MPPRLWTLGLVLLWSTAGVGCARRESHELRVDGRNFGAFYYWRSSVSSQFTPQRWREFNAAVDELRLRAMGGGITGTDAINDAVCREINGRTVDEVLRLGDEAKLARLVPLRNRLKTIVDANALLAAQPGDADLAQSLDNRRLDQQQRLATLTAEIEAARRALLAHGGSGGPALQIDERPAVLSREEALLEFERLIQARLKRAEDWYGDWPARFDTDGTYVPEGDRAAFLDRLQAGKANGREVIAVWLRGRWWIFDAVVQYPELSTSVTGNLRPDDRRAMRETWAYSEAEIWARRQAAQESADTAVANIKAGIEAVMKPK